MQFYIWYQSLSKYDSNITFNKYYNDGTTWKNLKQLQEDSDSLTVIKMYEV